MKSASMDWIGLLGRLLMSVIFIVSGFGIATAPAATMAYFGSKGLPVVGAVYALTLLIELGGGLAFLVGFRARLVGLILAVWCIATAMVAHYHPFEQIQFMKNLCMAGGFLQVVAFGPGRIALGRQ